MWPKKIQDILLILLRNLPKLCVTTFWYSWSWETPLNFAQNFPIKTTQHSLPMTQPFGLI